MVLNPEMNIEPTARYSRLVFSNAKTNVDPIARNSKIVWFKNLNTELNNEFTGRYSRCMFSNAELKFDPIAGYSSAFHVECRTERRSYISIFKVCLLVNAELNIASAP